MANKKVQIRPKVGSSYPDVLHPETSIDQVLGLQTQLNTMNTNINGKAPTSHAHDYIPTSATCNKNWQWSGQPGMPQWVWGGFNGQDMYVYDPSIFSVSNANTLKHRDLCTEVDNLKSTVVSGKQEVVNAINDKLGYASGLTTTHTHTDYAWWIRNQIPSFEKITAYTKNFNLSSSLQWLHSSSDFPPNWYVDSIDGTIDSSGNGGTCNQVKDGVVTDYLYLVTINSDFSTYKNVILTFGSRTINTFFYPDSNNTRTFTIIPNHLSFVQPSSVQVSSSFDCNVTISFIKRRTKI